LALLRKIYGCYHDLVKRDEISVSHVTTHMFRLLWSNPTLSSLMAYNPIFSHV